MRKGLIFVFTLIFAAANAQKTSFDIIVNDKVVGEATMTKNVINANEYTLKYTFEATITILFIKTTVNMKTNVKYRNGQVVNSDVDYLYNNKRLLRSVVWNGNNYDVTTDGKKSTLDKKAFFSVMNLYEKEPIGISEMYLEKDNEFTPIKSLGNNLYFAKVDGDDCTYTYKNGKLQKILVDAFVNLSIVRKN